MRKKKRPYSASLHSVISCHGVRGRGQEHGLHHAADGLDVGSVAGDMIEDESLVMKRHGCRFFAEGASTAADRTLSIVSRGTDASLNLRMLRLREMASRVFMARLLFPCRCLQPLFGASAPLLHLGRAVVPSLAVQVCEDTHDSVHEHLAHLPPLGGSGLGGVACCAGVRELVEEPLHVHVPG